MLGYENQGGGLDSNSILGGLIGLARGVGEVVAVVNGKPNGLATPTQAQQATKTAAQSRPWLPWVIGGGVVIVLAVGGFLLLRKS
ncbi:MAG: hypothetical protein ABMA26_16170 [Limisphaerales bacterium]